MLLVPTSERDGYLQMRRVSVSGSSAILHLVLRLADVVDVRRFQYSAIKQLYVCTPPFR